MLLALVVATSAYGFAASARRPRPLLTAMRCLHDPGVVLARALLVILRSYGLINTFPG